MYFKLYLFIMKTIIIAEKSSMWANIAKWLWITNKWKWYLYKWDVIITWAVWHLIWLKTPNEIDEKYKLWKMENLPIFFDLKEHYEISDKTKDQFNNIYNIFKGIIDKWEKIEFYHAWDPDREWELITRLLKEQIIKKLKNNNIDLSSYIEKEYRMWLKDFSKKTIENEFNKKTPIENYNNFYQAALARQHSDWLIWMNLTPYYTLVSWSYWETLNVWRVQSAILKIIVDKELEILNFKEELTYKLLGTFDEQSVFVAEWFSEKLKDWKLSSLNQYEIVKKDLENKKEFKVISKKIEEKQENLIGLYTLTDLQLDAEKKYWYEPSKTLSLMQSLYETHKIMSYPRTDSWFLAEDDFEKAKEWLLWMINDNIYWPKINKFKNENKILGNSNFVDNKKVWAHSWIYLLSPDEWTIQSKYNNLNTDEKNIFNLILNRLLWVMSWSYIYESSELILNNSVHYFKVKWKIVKDNGWKEYYKINNKQSIDTELPNLEEGDFVNLIKIASKEIKNQKPTRYSKSTLWKSIENLALLVKDNKELSERIKKISPKGERQLWLWTPQTRTSIIDWLEWNGFIVIKSKKISPTNKWFKLISIIKDTFRDPITTWEWEDILKNIEEWKDTYDSFINLLKGEINKVINEKTLKWDELYPFNPVLSKSIWICPKCWIWEILEWEKWFSCSWNKCDFIIWKDFLWKKFIEKEIINLLQWKMLEKVKMYSVKKKKDYEANIYLDKEAMKVKMKF